MKASSWTALVQRATRCTGSRRTTRPSRYASVIPAKGATAPSASTKPRRAQSGAEPSPSAAPATAPSSASVMLVGMPRQVRARTRVIATPVPTRKINWPSVPLTSADVAATPSPKRPGPAATAQASTVRTTTDEAPRCLIPKNSRAPPSLAPQMKTKAMAAATRKNGTGSRPSFGARDSVVEAGLVGDVVPADELEVRVGARLAVVADHVRGVEPVLHDEQTIRIGAAEGGTGDHGAVTLFGTVDRRAGRDPEGGLEGVGSLAVVGDEGVVALARGQEVSLTVAVVEDGQTLDVGRDVRPAVPGIGTGGALVGLRVVGPGDPELADLVHQYRGPDQV